LNVQSGHFFTLLTTLSCQLLFEKLSESSSDEAESSDKDYWPTCKMEISPGTFDKIQFNL